MGKSKGLDFLAAQPRAEADYPSTSVSIAKLNRGERALAPWSKLRVAGEEGFVIQACS